MYFSLNFLYSNIFFIFIFFYYSACSSPIHARHKLPSFLASLFHDTLNLIQLIKRPRQNLLPSQKKKQNCQWQLPQSCRHSTLDIFIGTQRLRAHQPPCNHKDSSQNSSVITVNFPVKLIQVCDMNSFVQFSRSRTFCISLNPAKRPNIVMLQHSGKKSYVKHPDTYLCFCVIFFGSRYLIIL